MPRTAALLPIALLLGACDPGCEAAEALEPGEMAGTLGDEDWSASGTTWFAAATGVTVSGAPGVDDWRVTFVAQKTDDGRDAAKKARNGGLPIDVILMSGQEGGWATVNRGSADTYTTSESEGGTLRLSRKAGGDLYGCGAFTASAGPRDLTASLAFRALAADLGPAR